MQIRSSCLKKVSQTAITTLTQHQLVANVIDAILTISGEIVGQGTYEELNKGNKYFSKLIRKYGAMEKTGKKKAEEAVEKGDMSKAVKKEVPPENAEENEGEDKKETDEERRKRGELISVSADIFLFWCYHYTTIVIIINTCLD